jgi:hypothetical protein
MALETSVSSYFNQLTRLVAREDFIIQCHRESSRSYIFICNVMNNTFMRHYVFRDILIIRTKHLFLKCMHLSDISVFHIFGICSSAPPYL